MRRRGLAPFALLAVVITGCSSSGPHAAAPPPVVTPPAATASPSAAPTPAPTPSATPFISAATEAGAYAFVKAYFAELDRALCVGGCFAACAVSGGDVFLSWFRAEYSQLLRPGREAGWRVRLFIDNWVFGDHGPGFAKAATQLSYQHGTKRLAPAGVDNRRRRAERGIYVIDLTPRAQHWVLRDVRSGPSSKP